MSAATDPLTVAGSPPQPAPSGPRIIGLDLSLTATGIASKGWVDTLRPPNNVGKSYGRLAWLRQSIRDVTPDSTDLVIVEGLAFHAHDRDNAGAGLWWLVTFDLWKRGLDVVVMSPGGRAKYATGKGNAPKDAVLAAVVRRFPGYEVSNNNEADALSMVAAAYDHYGQPLTQMPETHRAALAAVSWPDLAGAT